jgi:hypothetical protein
MPQWRWNILPAIAAAAFAEKPDEPLPIWASKHVFLDRRITTRPGYYDPDEYAWTWEFQEIIRTRHIWEKKLDGDGATRHLSCRAPSSTPAVKARLPPRAFTRSTR